MRPLRADALRGPVREDSLSGQQKCWQQSSGARTPALDDADDHYFVKAKLSTQLLF